MIRGYEFDEGENAVFSSLASGMKFVGVVLMILGALSILSALAGNFGAAVNGVIYLSVFNNEMFLFFNLNLQTTINNDLFVSFLLFFCCLHS